MPVFSMHIHAVFHTVHRVVHIRLPHFFGKFKSYPPLSTGIFCAIHMQDPVFFVEKKHAYSIVNNL